MNLPSRLTDKIQTLDLQRYALLQGLYGKYTVYK